MTGIISFLAGVDWWTLVTGAALGALTGTITLGLKLVLQQPIKTLTEQRRIIEIFSRLFPQAPFNGDWQVTWTVESDRYPEQNVDVVRIRKLRSNVTFTTIATLKDGSSQECVFVGKLLNGSVTGRWYNPEDQDHGYFGAFQFRVHGSLRSAAGVWVGWRNDGTVASGEMTLTRV